MLLAKKPSDERRDGAGGYAHGEQDASTTMLEGCQPRDFSLQRLHVSRERGDLGSQFTNLHADFVEITVANHGRDP